MSKISLMFKIIKSSWELWQIKFVGVGKPLCQPNIKMIEGQFSLQAVSLWTSES